MRISVLSIGQQPLAVAVTIVSIAGVLLFGAWFRFSRHRPLGRIRGFRARVIPSTMAALSATVDARVTRPRREPARKTRSGTPPPTGDAPRRSRVARFDEVFADSVMRRVVRADQVKLLSVPHEVYGVPLTEIASGREVELIEHRDTWAKVRTPWGEEGWVPAGALGT